MSDFTTLVLHHNDPDGYCAGAIVNYFEPDCRCYKMNYGYDVPWNLIKRAKKVYMVDFSFQPFADMLKLKELKGDNFIWIDHHFTSIDDAVKSGQTFKGTQITGKSGCELTWEYFTDEPMHDIVKIIGR